MNPSEPRETPTEPQVEARLRRLQYAPSPNLARGRARLLARVERQAHPLAAMSRRLTFALALGVSVALILVLFVMAGATSEPRVATVALTRTDAFQRQTLAPIAVPGNLAPSVVNGSATNHPSSTPLPGIVPEPPHAPSLTLPRPLSPGSLN